MRDKKAISRKYLLLYILTVLFSVLYSSFFIVTGIFLAFGSYWMLDVCLFPVCVGSIRILFALLPRINLEKDNSLVFSENCFVENTKRIAAAMKSSYPENIYVVYNSNAFAFSKNGKEAIAIGLPLTIIMNKYELSFVIAHELAHHFLGDVRYGKNIKRVEYVFEKLMSTLSNRWVAILAGPYRFVAKRIFKEIKKLSRQNEHYADLHAAEIVGKHSALSALKSIEVSDNSWNFYLNVWIWLLNEYEIYVDIVENYSLFVALTYSGTDNLEIRKKESDIYDSHPTTYERVLEVENKCVNENAIIELEEYNIDSVKLSRHFWSIYNGENTKDLNISIVDSSKKAMEVLADKITGDFKYIFESYTYSDASSIMSIYPKVSYNLYQKTQDDNFEFERFMIIRILSFIIFKKVKPENWRIGPLFTPIIILKDEEIELHSIMLDNFEHNSTSWSMMLKALDINDQDLISELD